jgi:S-DNA-T family DNA segregation ATPase FtsK/SpoIIIE
MVLRNFDSLKHVGGVVVSNEDEKFKNLMKLLLSEIEERKDKLMKAGVSSFVSYREAGFKDIPQIVLLIDNYTAVKEYYLQEDDPIMQICREGLTVGISTVIANSQTSGMGYRYMSNFAKRIVFYCNESGEYSNVIEKCRTAPDNTPGRALTEIGKQIYELQTYLSFEGEREIERVTTMRSFVEFTNAQVVGQARRIPVIPEVLELDDFTTSFCQQERESYVVPVGLFYDPIVPVEIDLLNQGWFAIAGRGGAGNRNMLHVICDYLYNNMFSCPAEIYIVDSVDRKLSQFEQLGIVEEYSIDASDAATIVENIYTELTKRYQEFTSGDLNILAEPLKLIVIRNQDAIDSISKNTTIMKEYKELIGKLKSMKVCFIFMDIPNASINYSAPEIMKAIKDTKNLFFFDDLQNLKIVDVSTVTLRKFRKKISMGDAYWLSGNDISKIKTIKRKER